MSDKTKTAGVAMNYTKAMEAQIVEASPLNLETAKALGASFNPPKSFRSVIAKAKSLGCEYESKPTPTKKVAAVTKVELVAQIEKTLDRKLSGLDKATSSALLALINGIDHIKPVLIDAPLPEIGDNA